MGYEVNEETLLKAVKENDLEKVRELLDSGVDIEARYKNDDTCLHLAASTGNEALVKLLLERGASINSQNIYQQTPLDIAAHAKELDMVKFLLENGANVNLANKFLKTPLYHAVDKENIELVKLLLENGADVNLISKAEQTALYHAVEKENLPLVKLLLENGANANLTGVFGNIPLYHAVKKENLAIVKLLLKKGADVNLTYITAHGYKETPLYHAVEKENLAIVKLLLDKGANANFTIIDTDGYKETLLSCAIYKQNLDSVKLLLEKGAEVDEDSFYELFSKDKDLADLLLSYSKELYFDNLESQEYFNKNPKSLFLFPNIKEMVREAIKTDDPKESFEYKFNTFYKKDPKDLFKDNYKGYEKALELAFAFEKGGLKSLSAVRVIKNIEEGKAEAKDSLKNLPGFILLKPYFEAALELFGGEDSRKLIDEAKKSYFESCKDKESKQDEKPPFELKRSHAEAFGESHETTKFAKH